MIVAERAVARRRGPVAESPIDPELLHQHEHGRCLMTAHAGSIRVVFTDRRRMIDELDAETNARELVAQRLERLGLFSSTALFFRLQLAYARAHRAHGTLAFRRVGGESADVRLG